MPKISKETITYLVGVDVLGFPVYHTHILTYTTNPNHHVKDIHSLQKRSDARLNSSIESRRSGRRSIRTIRGAIGSRGR